MIPTKEQQRQIRRILSLPKNSRFPRCAATARQRIKEFEASGDYSHSKKGHTCAKCRCRHTAGHGTSGDFYGLGDERVGHYGVGFCHLHELGIRKGVCRKYAVNHMKALQTRGTTDDAVEEYKIDVSEDASVAQQAIEVRNALSTVRDVLTEFQRKCIEGEKDEDRVISALQNLHVAIKDAEFVDPKQGEDLLTLIRDEIFARTNVTETSGGKLVRISDKSRFELGAKLAKTATAIALDVMKLNGDKVVHVDELKVRIPRMISLAERFIHDDEDRKKFVAEFADIWRPIKTGNRT